MYKDTFIGVILPAFNEAGKVSRVIEKITRDASYVDVIIVVDDCSSDTTASESEALGARVLRHPKNRGVGAAIRTGIEFLQENHPEAIAVVMASDDQDVPSEMPRLLDPIINDGADFVQGSRRLFGRRTRKMPLFRRLTTKIYSLVLTIFTFRAVTDGTNGYRAFRLTILNDPKIRLDQDWLDRYELEPYLLFRVLTGPFQFREAPVTKIDPEDKTIGYSKMTPFVSWWSILRPVIFLRFGIRK